MHYVCDILVLTKLLTSYLESFIIGNNAKIACNGVLRHTFNL